MKSPNISDEYILQKRKEIGVKLKELRENKGLTMDQLGELIGTGKSTISKIEAGKWNFGIDTLTMFSVALDFNVELF